MDIDEFRQAYLRAIGFEDEKALRQDYEELKAEYHALKARYERIVAAVEHSVEAVLRIAREGKTE